MEFGEMEEEKQSAKIRMTAMDMLSYREFSRFELANKLAKKFENSPLIEAVISQLTKDDLQSDKRFSEAFVRSRISRGQGEIRIRMELKNRGIENELAQRAIDNCDIDWYSLAADTAINKFGDGRPVDNRERAKRMRFLQYRGFTYEQISHALSKHNAQS
jgi:regulatory protein